MKYKDCYSTFDEKKLTVGNKYTERVIEISNGIPISRSFTDKHGNKCWNGNRIGMFSVCDFDYEAAKITYSESTNPRLESEIRALTATLCLFTPQTEIKVVFTVYPETPGITTELYLRGKYAYSESYDITTAANGIEPNTVTKSATTLPPKGTVDCLNISEQHLKLESVRLFDHTDQAQELYTESEELLYSRFYKSFAGNVFTVTDTMTENSLLIAREGYTGDSDQGSLRVKPTEAITVKGNRDCDQGEYSDFIRLGGVTVVCGNSRTVKRSYRNIYSLKCGNLRTFTMSNTWGDRNQDSRICEKFILSEIEQAAKLGIDIVQVDDGWQKGTTGNSALNPNKAAWGKYYSTDKCFWDINRQKFPKGLTDVAESAKKKGVELGLWFSLDSTDNYAMWNTDASVILDLYRKYDIKHFKIDGLTVMSPISENNILRFMERLHVESNGEIRLNMDITAGRRLGYFLYPRYSTLFVENRYTDWGNYYPAYTLRALWDLAHIFPTSRLQFEFLNIQRNKDKYLDSDPLRPEQYETDYLFASVMMSCPLAWMELSSLPENDTERLKRVIKVYQELKDELSTADVSPIGQRPNGFAHTGFLADCKNGTGIAVLLTEPLTKCENYTYELPTDRFSSAQILLTDQPNASVTVECGKIVLPNTPERSYMICRLT